MYTFIGLNGFKAFHQNVLAQLLHLYGYVIGTGEWSMVNGQYLCKEYSHIISVLILLDWFIIAHINLQCLYIVTYKCQKLMSVKLGKKLM